MLKVEDINVYYGSIHAIKQVSFEVKEGEIVSLIGANGAGKSTVLKTISGLLRSQSGSITFLNQEISQVDSYRLVKKGLAHVPEGRRIFLRMSVQENLEMGAYTQRKVVPLDFEQIYQRFPRLKERRNQIAGTLSGGEQQMLAIGRAFMSDPKLLCIDEPSTGLAPLIRQEVFEKISEISRLGITILLVEQEVSTVFKMASRNYVLSSGKILAQGTGQQLLADEVLRKTYLGL